MQRHLRNWLFSALAFALALGGTLALLAGIAIVRGQGVPPWTEPANAPPSASIGAPVTASEDSAHYQMKAGKLSVHDALVLTLGKWMSDLWQFAPLPNFPGNPLVSATTASGNPPQLANAWNPVTLSQAALVTIPGAAPARVTALLLKVACGEAFVWLTAESPLPPVPSAPTVANTSSVNWRLACASANNDGDTQTVFLPVNPAPGAPVTLYYRAQAVNPSTVGVRIDLVGAYYHH